MKINDRFIFPCIIAFKNGQLSAFRCWADSGPILYAGWIMVAMLPETLKLLEYNLNTVIVLIIIYILSFFSQDYCSLEWFLGIQKHQGRRSGQLK